MILYPLSVLYINGQKKKPTSWFSDRNHARRAILIMAAVSIAMLLIVLFLLNKLGTSLFS